jgi:hypothetical protein
LSGPGVGIGPRQADFVKAPQKQLPACGPGYVATPNIEVAFDMGLFLGYGWGVKAGIDWNTNTGVINMSITARVGTGIGLTAGGGVGFTSSTSQAGRSSSTNIGTPWGGATWGKEGVSLSTPPVAGQVGPHLGGEVSKTQNLTKVKTLIYGGKLLCNPE